MKKNNINFIEPVLYFDSERERRQWGVYSPKFYNILLFDG